MAQINLLPWRETLRAQRQREFGIMALAGVVLTVLAMWGWHQYNVSLIENQKNRNRYLESQIAELDQQITEIRGLEKTRKQLIARMRVVASLQSSRPQIVHLFDELVATLPDGVHLTEVIQSGSGVSVLGRAQSNARVSAYMRAVEGSPWLDKPSLRIIEQKDQAGEGANTFSMGMQQVVPKAGDGQ